MAGKDLKISDGGALFQIAEPVSKRAPSTERRAGRAIGIDLGTTHSVVAWAKLGPPRAFLGEDGSALLPSVVAYLSDGIVVGSRARSVAVQHPQRVIISAKRFIGRSVEDIHFSHPYRFADTKEDARGIIRFDLSDGRTVNPVQVSAEILKSLKVRAESEMGDKVDGAVVTVPAYFDDAQRQATKDACRLAGLNVYRLLAEPTAAALAYGLDAKQQGLFAVYDLGGGTFDVSLLRLRDGIFQVLATGGDTGLGGDDFDRALANDLLQRAGVESATPAQIQATQAASRRVKEDLSEREAVTFSIPEINLENVRIDRGSFEALIDKLVSRTIHVCRQTLKDAGLRPKELQGVVLVGGSTRVPLVRDRVETFFGQTPLCDIDPDYAVAYGAAIQADILSGNPREGVTLLDVAPLSLGLETMGGMVEKIIPRNATIPISARQTFTNYSEKQTGMTITVVQGERELAKDCRTVAAFELKGIPSLPPGLARVEVTFQLDADGLLTVTARELMTGTAQTIEVKPSYGLSAQEVDQLIADSLNHARDDFNERNLAEARVELGRVILAVRRALDERGDREDLLPTSEREELQRVLEAADAAVQNESSDTQQLRKTLQELERVSEPFARRRMEDALRAGMDGRSVNELEGELNKEAASERDRKRGGHAATRTDPPTQKP